MDSLSLAKEAYNIQWRKYSIFMNWYWENWSTTKKRMKLEHFLTPYTKINPRWIKDLNVRPENMKLLEENRHNSLQAKSQQDALWPCPRLMEIKTKISKWNLIKPKSYCTMKETISRVKRKPSEWERIANKTTNKELLSKIYK